MYSWQCFTFKVRLNGAKVWKLTCPPELKGIVSSLVRILYKFRNVFYIQSKVTVPHYKQHSYSLHSVQHHLPKAKKATQNIKLSYQLSQSQPSLHIFLHRCPSGERNVCCNVPWNPIELSYFEARGQGEDEFHIKIIFMENSLSVVVDPFKIGKLHLKNLQWSHWCSTVLQKEKGSQLAYSKASAYITLSFSIGMERIWTTKAKRIFNDCHLRVWCSAKFYLMTFTIQIQKLEISCNY